MDTKPPTILLVDDEVSVRNFYQLFLEHEGFAVVPASTTVEAIHLLATLTPVLVLVDIFLGADSGLDLVRALLAARPDLPIIVISGIGYDEPIFQEALQAGAMGVYSKTLPPDRLLALIRTTLRTRFMPPQGPGR